MPENSPLKLLVVDDHAEFRRTVRHIFEAYQSVVAEADSGEEAVKQFAEWRPDWVIMDLRMPGMGGIKATEAIRKLDPAARVIIISQFTQPEFRDQARQAGAVNFVDKENVSLLVELILAPPSKT